MEYARFARYGQFPAPKDSPVEPTGEHRTGSSGQTVGDRIVDGRKKSFVFTGRNFCSEHLRLKYSWFARYGRKYGGDTSELQRQDRRASALPPKPLVTDPGLILPFCSRGRGLQLSSGTKPIGVGRFRPPGIPVTTRRDRALNQSVL